MEPAGAQAATAFRYGFHLSGQTAWMQPRCWGVSASVSSVVVVSSLRSWRNAITSPWTMSERTVQN